MDFFKSWDKFLKPNPSQTYQLQTQPIPPVVFYQNPEPNPNPKRTKPKLRRVRSRSLSDIEAIPNPKPNSNPDPPHSCLRTSFHFFHFSPSFLHCLWIYMLSYNATVFTFSGDAYGRTPRSPWPSSEYRVLKLSCLPCTDGEQLKRGKMSLWKQQQS